MARGASRERLVVLALGVVGAALALLAATRPWLDITIKDPLAGSGRLHPDGRTAAALVPAASLVALAASVAAVTMRRVGRQVAGLLLVAAGGAMAAATIRAIAHPAAAAVDAVREATGRTGDVGVTASATGLWPGLAVVAAALVVLAGAATIVRGRAWTGLSGRYDAPVAGDDPGRPGHPGRPADGAPADAGNPDAAWDALSRGEDPTG